MRNSNAVLRDPSPRPGVWDGSNPRAFSGFQISVTDYPAISSLCLFDFLHRLKAIPDQTSFIDETTQPPRSVDKHNTARCVQSRGADDTNLLEESLHIPSAVNAPPRFPIRDL